MMSRRSILLLERTKDPANEVSLDPFPGIPNPDHQVHLSFDLMHLPEGDAHRPSCRCELHGIGDKINDNLCQTQFVSDHSAHIKILHRDLPTDILRLRRITEHRVKLLRHPKEIKGHCLQFHLPTLDPGHIQDIIDQGKQKLRQALRTVQIIVRLFRIFHMRSRKA